MTVADLTEAFVLGQLTWEGALEVLQAKRITYAPDATMQAMLSDKSGRTLLVEPGFGFREERGRFSLLANGSLLEPEKMPPKPANPTGVSGKHDPQAEQLFAKAHVLWKGETCTDPEKALEYLDEALKIEPDYPQALIRRGLALSQLGYADDAFDDLTKAIRIEPSAEAYLSRGICLLQQGNTAGARKDLEEALRRDDRSYRVWNILGAVSLKEGKEQEACEAFEKACSSGDCAGIEAARREKICK